MPLVDHGEAAVKEGLLKAMRWPDRSTASAVQFSRRNVATAKLLLRKEIRPAPEAVRVSCSSTVSADPTCSRSKAGANLDPPSYLVDEIAVREWATVAPVLEHRGLLDECMKPLVAGYCNALARSVRAEQVLAKEGRYYRSTTQKGAVIKRRHPAVQDAKEGWASVRHFAKQLGISFGTSSMKSRISSNLSMFK